MIKAIIFDLGGVVINWTDDIIFRNVAERFELDYNVRDFPSVYD